MDAEGPYTITTTALVLLLGELPDFTVRAYLSLGGYRSLDFDPVTLSKV